MFHENIIKLNETLYDENDDIVYLILDYAKDDIIILYTFVSICIKIIQMYTK